MCQRFVYVIALALALVTVTVAGVGAEPDPEPAFLAVPQYVGPPQPQHAVTNRAFQGIPSMAVTPGGRLWANWYAGKTPGEDQNNYVVLSTSGDNGATWREVLVVDPDGEGPARTFDPELWMAPDGKLRMFWAQAQGHEATLGGVWCLQTAEPESEQPVWEKPVRITNGVMMCKPLVLTTGEWVLPASTWRKTDNSAKLVVSTDQGRIWTVRGGCQVPVADRAFDEHMLIERRDGSLWLLARTRYGIGESVSTDRGVTWPELKPSAIAHPSARFFITRLSSGNLLLVKHGPIDKPTDRSHLTAFVSTDDGRSWGGGLLLDERSGVSYPDGQQTPDGLIRIIYDFSRTGARHILMATFREEDAAAGKAVSDAVHLRQLVSQAAGGLQPEPPPVAANQDGEPLRKEPPGALAAEDAPAQALAVGELLFTDRGYVLSELPAALQGASFLRVKLDGQKEVRCSRAGVVYLLTPEPGRNKDSQTQALLDQGFKKVALPEVRLFDPSSAANFCTLYQKDCAAGDTIKLGKWAVPLFFSLRSETVNNPLTAEWTGPYHGVPPFDGVKVADLKPALEAGMNDQLAAIDAITSNEEPATFDNTLAALEASSRMLDRVSAIYDVWSSTMSTPDFQEVEREMEPKLAAFRDRIVQNEKLFARIAAAYEARDTLCRTPEQKRLAWLYYTNFVRAGAKLDAAGKKQVAEINERLASLYTSFTQNILGEEKEYTLFLDQAADLDGLPDSVVSAAAAAAEARGQPGKWAILNTRSSVEPFLSFSTRRDLREKVWRTFVSRGDHGDARDNKKIITEVFQLRAERAKLLGYATHAHWRVENAMAKTPERAMELLEAVWPAAVARVKEEVADMQAIADREGAKITIEPWDYRYYAEKVRKAKYDLNENEVKPYLQLDKLREGMFYVAAELLDLHFVPAQDVPVYHPDVRVWEVQDGQGRHVGLWYFDPYAREGKRSGAWMNAYRSQERFAEEIPTIVSNNSNFVKGQPGEPVLLSWTDAETLFHEFGHAVHGLSSNVTYPSLSGTAVARDYVEFPSQILERWLSTPEVLGRFALHHETGKPLPMELRQKIEKADKFNQGFATVEYLASALVDLKAHLAGDTTIEAAAFERDTLTALGMPREIVMRHRMPHFLHVFASDGYAAGYYSYLWADTLSADAYEAFLEGAGPFDKAIAKKLKQHVFSAVNVH